MTNHIDYNQLGKQIKRYRLKAHLTQEQLAEKTDVATPIIAHAENGTSKLSLPLLLKVANALNVSLDQLVCGSLSVIDTYIEKDIADSALCRTITLSADILRMSFSRDSLMGIPLFLSNHTITVYFPLDYC